MDLSFGSVLSGAFSDINNQLTTLASATKGGFPGVNYGGSDAPGTTYYGSQSAAQAAGAGSGSGSFDITTMPMSISAEPSTATSNSASGGIGSDYVAAVTNATPQTATGGTTDWNSLVNPPNADITQYSVAGVDAQDPGYADPNSAGNNIPKSIIVAANTQGVDTTKGQQTVANATTTAETTLSGYLTGKVIMMAVVIMGVIVVAAGLHMFKGRMVPKLV